MQHLRGKALFLRNWRYIDANPDVAATTYMSWGFRWAVVPIMWADGGISGPLITSIFAPLRRLGVSAWAMGYFTPANWAATLVPFMATAKSAGAVGVCLDVEAEWKGQPEAAALFTRMAQREARRTGLALCITSYGSPQLHPTFPWAAFAPIGVGIAQVYDRNEEFKPSYAGEGIAAWRARGFRTVIPAGSLWGHARNAPKPPESVQRHVDLMPPTPGVIFWTNPPDPAQGFQPAQRMVLLRWQPRAVYPKWLDFVLSRPVATAVFGG